MIFTRRYDNKLSECMGGRRSTTLHLRQRQLDLKANLCPMFFFFLNELGMNELSTTNRTSKQLKSWYMFTELENPEKLFGLLQGWLISTHSSYISQRRKSCGICQNKNTNEAKKSTQKARQRKKKRASTNNNVSRQSNHLRQLLPPSTYKKQHHSEKKT